jgi:hypothetical protein
MDVVAREIANQDLGTLIEEHRREVHTPEGRVQAVKLLLRGIVDWISDEPTIAALIVEDVARMVALCEDSEDLRDLSVQIRDLMFEFEPDASRVALTEEEAGVLHTLEKLEA